MGLLFLHNDAILNKTYEGVMNVREGNNTIGLIDDMVVSKVTNIFQKLGNGKRHLWNISKSIEGDMIKFMHDNVYKTTNVFANFDSESYAWYVPRYVSK